ncbi:MAG: type II toxin-antitoxin system PemK/MazF family toxin [Oscillospiraceae bacterium]|nr:type II toxin-antitoxin system PemK/MazF family toxin [Oscillospiraceae bacterium]
MCKPGDIYWANLPRIPGSQVQQGGKPRPVVVCVNYACCRFSPIVHVVPLTSKKKKNNLPTHVAVSGFGLPKPCTAMAEQLMPIDQKFLIQHIGNIARTSVYDDIQKAIKIQLAI